MSNPDDKVVYLRGCPQCAGRMAVVPYLDDKNQVRQGGHCLSCGRGWDEMVVRAVHFNRKTATVGGV